MAHLTLQLFGPGVLKLAGAVVHTHSAKTLALLAFLVLEPRRPHLRAHLVELLWHDVPETAGRQSLRQALYSLRTVAGGRLNDCLRVDKRCVQFEAPAEDAPIDIDVPRFLAAVRSTDENDWREATTLQQAPLLDGGRFAPGSAYEGWLVMMRDRLRALAMQNLERLIVSHLARDDWAAAAGFAETMCQFDTTSEAASRYLLRIFARQGQTHALDAEWARLCGELSQKLGVGPSAQMVDLHRALRERGAGLSARPKRIMLDATGEADAMVRAGQAAERVFAFSHAADLYDRALRVIRRHMPESAQRCVDVLLSLEGALERLGRRADQASAIDEAMSIARDLNDAPRVAILHLRRAGVCAYLRRHQEARAAAEHALKIFRDVDDGPGEAEALRELGFVHWHAEDHSEALQRTREALELHRRIGDVTGEATALHNLAEIHRGLGSPRQAAQWFEQAMRLHWAARNPGGEILSLFGWANALRQAGDLAGSTEKYEAALRLSEHGGERVMHSRVLHALSMQHASQGTLDTALDFLRRAIAIDRAIGYAHALGHDLIDCSDLHLLRGEVAEARIAMQEALVWYGLTEDIVALASTRARLAEFDAKGGASMLRTGLRGGVKSHLSLSEGKVYCEFETPLAVHGEAA
ncbi:MAG: tetratricopeptide repeat protein [Burkholderiaceae bacterium]